MNLRLAILFLAVAASPMAATHAQVTDAGKTSNAIDYGPDDFVRDARGTPHLSKSEMDVPTFFAIRYADGYIAGVVDATQGTSWCAPARLKESELDERVWVSMRDLKGAMRGNAAIAILGQLNANYPCGTERTLIAPRFEPKEFVKDFLGLSKLKGGRRSPPLYKQHYEYGDPEARAIYKERYATGYADGVMQATQGKDWCVPAQINTSELVMEAVAGMDKPRAWHRRANAAKELLVHLNEKFPCK